MSEAHLENANSQESHVAVSEENLAALLRATVDSPELAAEQQPEETNAAPPVRAPELRAPVPNPVSAPLPVPPPAPTVEARVARLAEVREKLAANSRPELGSTKPPIDRLSAAKGNIAEPPAKQLPKPPLSSSPAVASPPVRLRESAPPKAALPVSTPSWKANNAQSESTINGRLVIGLIIGAVIVAITGYTFWSRAHAAKSPSVAASASKDNIPLQIRVEPLGNGTIDVRWNPQNAAIATARDGRLVITEPNQQPRTLALDAQQLKTGHVTYQSTADSIGFDLEVVDRSGAIVKESVLALQSPKSSPPPSAPSPAPEVAHSQTVAAKAPTVAVPEPPVDTPQARPIVRNFVAPAPRQGGVQRAIVDAPPSLVNGPVTPPEVGLSAPLPVIAPPPKNAAPQQVRVESNIEAANLLKKVVPVYPQLAKSTHIQGSVRFTARIGKDGRILNLKFVSGPPVLADAASAAVKQWVYRPTLLDGEPVEVLTQIDVNFTLH